MSLKWLEKSRSDLETVYACTDIDTLDEWAYKVVLPDGAVRDYDEHIAKLTTDISTLPDLLPSPSLPSPITHPEHFPIPPSRPFRYAAAIALIGGSSSPCPSSRSARPKPNTTR